MSIRNNFIWGVTTAAYQVEGAAFEDGRGTSIWDTFSTVPGKVYAGENGNVSVDQYHRYKEDIALMKELGLDAYSFTIAWPRIFPNATIDGNGALNPKGFDYYHRLIDELLANNIMPKVTLYHWDLPQGIQDGGGWANRSSTQLFAEYASTVFEALGDKVSMWSPFNEPWCTAVLGYLLGIHAPGIEDRVQAYAAIHHLNLSHGLAVQSLRNSRAKDSRIGPVLNLYAFQPATDTAEDKAAANRAMDANTRMFMNPLFGKPYPQRHLDALNITLPIEDGDLDIIASKIDFIGLNYYEEFVVSNDETKPDNFEIKSTPNTATTDMGWSIVPKGIFNLMHYVHKEFGPIDLYITENGAAMPDKLEGDAVHDYDRIYFLQEHIKACKEAIAQGIPLKGYFAWSFIDNFEWSFGYTKRFGLVYCDYATLARTPKDSFYAYKEIIRESRKD